MLIESSRMATEQSLWKNQKCFLMNSSFKIIQIISDFSFFFFKQIYSLTWFPLKTFFFPPWRSFTDSRGKQCWKRPNSHPRRLFARGVYWTVESYDQCRVVRQHQKQSYPFFFFSFSSSAQVPDNDEQFVPDFQTENCKTSCRRSLPMSHCVFLHVLALCILLCAYISLFIFP